MRVFKWIVGLVCTLVILVGGGGYLWLKSTVPSYTGRVQAGVGAEVKVYRDRFGVASIVAEKEEDAFVALGYAMAQDRMFQMEMLRRAGSGRLAEILGPKLVEVDKLFLALTAFQSPEDLYKKNDPKLQGLLKRFAQGVNLFREKGPLPLEFKLLGLSPEPWQPWDSLAINMVMAWDLNLAWNYDLVNAAIAAKLGDDRIREFLPHYNPDYPTIIPKGGYSARAALDFVEMGYQAKAFLGAGAAPGSNSWVLAGARTETGRPLLANDPHLGFSQPPIWWEGAVLAGDLKVSGVFIPGIPLPLIGHTPHHGWGLTNVMADDADFFIEKINPDNKDEYLADGQWEPLKKIKRTLKVKGEEPREVVFSITRNGLIINGLKAPAKLGQAPLAMRWVGQDHTGDMQTFYGAAKARSWEEFKEAVSHFACPGQNFIYADVEGDIGWVAGVRIPLRRGGYDPTLPAEGSSGVNGWDGYLPFEAQPALYNPPEGFIVTANNKSVGEEYPHYISTYWAGPERASRIRELILAKDKLSAADIRDIQADVYSKAAETLRPYLLAAFEGQGVSDQEKEALALIKDWDLNMEVDSAPAAVFEMFFARLFTETLVDDLGEELTRAYLRNHYAAVRSLPGWLAENSPLFDDRGTKDKKEDRDQIIRRSLRKAVLDMEKLQDKLKVKDWAWGWAHKVTFAHAFQGQNGLLDKLINLGPYPVQGSMFTVNPTQYRIADLGNFATRSGASMRQIIDLGEIGKSVRAITTGQSGHFMSPHYGDQAGLWLNVRHHATALERQAIEKTAEMELSLIPTS